MKKGQLILIPTPLKEELPLEPVALENLRSSLTQDHVLYCVEDIKPGRKRWLSWGLPRERVEDLVCYNEHTREEIREELFKKMKDGYTVFLMSDGGLPAFCDPGKDLVKGCHEKGIKVSATPFPHSISLALALSGIDHDRFYFAGFPPREKEQRREYLKDLMGRKETVVLMDAPYRMAKLCLELEKLDSSRKAFLGIELNGEDQELLYASLKTLTKKVEGRKAEFILILDNAHSK